jgi:hypothetical protein
MRINEKTITANEPITVVIGAKLAKKPVNGTSISAKPATIEAKNKKIQLFIVTPPLLSIYVHLGWEFNALAYDKNNILEE